MPNPEPGERKRGAITPEADAWVLRADLQAFLAEALRDSAEGRVQRFTRIALANYMRANAGD